MATSMSFNSLSWHDSQINSINIQDDKIVISVYQDALQKDCRIVCKEVVGITDLCMWDDSIISSATATKVADFTCGFLKSVFDAYGQNYNSDEYKALREDMIDISVELVNGIVFHIYCYGVTVETDE